MSARVLVPLQIAGTPPPWGQTVHVLQGQTMGTSWSVRLVGPAELRLAPIEAAIARMLDEVIAQMSQWEPDSDLSRINRAPAGSRHVLPAGFATVMDAAWQVAAASDGAFDPTAGELVRQWGFGPPGEAQAAHCNWRALQWDGHSLTQTGTARLDLSAIAKGYAVDRLSQLLTDCGALHHLAEIGGELRGTGFKPEGQPWWVDLEPPAADCGLAPLRIALHGLSIATSGDYRRCYIDDEGQRRSHTMDPCSGAPIAHGLAAVSVVHESAMWADAWSTALMVMGAEEGRRFASARGLAALFTQRRADGFEELFTPALKVMLT